MNSRTLLFSAHRGSEQPERGDCYLDAPPERLGSQGIGNCVLTYHEILPRLSKYRYRVTNDQFEAHLSLLRSSEFQARAKGKLPLITFDDGHRSNYEQAFPLLERYGLKGIFFVLAGCVSKDEKFITWEQARQMAASGHRVESHGWSHRLLTQCNAPELEVEVNRSKQELEDRIGVGISSISAPGGRWDGGVADACARAGYKYLYHSNPWFSATHRNGVNLRGRHMITVQMGPAELERLVTLGGLRRSYASYRHAAKERVRKLMGDRLYHQVWCWLSDWRAEGGIELELSQTSQPKRESGPK